MTAQPQANGPSSPAGCPSEFSMPMTPFSFSCNRRAGHTGGWHNSRLETQEDGSQFYVAWQDPPEPKEEE